MKLPQILPRLSRKQRVARNLLIALLAVFLVWAVNDFAPPTAALALRWSAASYGLPAPEVLYRGEGDAQDVIRAGDFLATTKVYGDLLSGYYTLPFQIAEQEGPVTLLWETSFLELEAFFVYADLPEDARAVCTLHVWQPVDISDVRTAWEETYTMEAAPNASGVYRFTVQRKYTEGDSRHLEALAEVRALTAVQKLGRGMDNRDAGCDIAIVFYDAEEKVVHTYEKVLAEGRKTE